MHLFDASKSFMGGYAIVAGHMPLACGLALAEQYKGTDRIAANFIGDGAVNEGEFHEALNLAAVWKLPVLFICENNLYGMGTAVRRVSARGRGLQARRGVRHRIGAGRRHGRRRRCTRPSRASRSACAPATARRSSRRSATASAATRWPTRSSTARRTRSSAGATLDPIEQLKTQLLDRRTRSRDADIARMQHGCRRDGARGGASSPNESPPPPLESLDARTSTRRPRDA